MTDVIISGGVAHFKLGENARGLAIHVTDANWQSLSPGSTVDLRIATIGPTGDYVPLDGYNAQPGSMEIVTGDSPYVAFRYDWPMDNSALVAGAYLFGFNVTDIVTTRTISTSSFKIVVDRA